jgi:ectoine hydroxylase-related dioxygenase (phytanoyl-CoA dioxygenase family)
VTSQVNCVNPGGAAQVAHRDYHLGFLTPERAAQFPKQVHQLSPFLTLQGAVAHVDMPLESGPTLYLPHSQKFQHGYLAANQAEILDYFETHHVQLPLKKGDAVFFTPALIPAAGNNRSTDCRRLANLLQVSSAFGRAMETVDRVRLAKALYPALLQRTQQGTLTPLERDAAIGASAEGYAFPTNLDTDPPRDGLAPPSQQDLMRRALNEQWPLAQFSQTLDQRETLRQSH